MSHGIKIGSHVGMSGKDMFLGSVKEAITYGSNTFMIYTGAPQNTKRKKIEELNIEAGWNLMREHGIEEFIVHAPYIINLANTVKPEVYELALEFLRLELERTKALGSQVLVLHPGSHVGAGAEAGIDQIAKGLNEVLTEEMPVCVALETMAGKGSEVGRNFEEIARIYDKVKLNHKLRVCFDTCHVSDSGYDIVHDYEKVMKEFDHYIGKNQIAAFHINDSKNPRGAGKDRHENAGFGHIGFDALRHIIYDEEFAHIPKILESPYVPGTGEKVKTYPPYKYEIEMYKRGIFDPELKAKIVSTKGL